MNSRRSRACFGDLRNFEFNSDRYTGRCFWRLDEKVTARYWYQGRVCRINMTFLYLWISANHSLWRCYSPGWSPYTFIWKSAFIYTPAVSYRKACHLSARSADRTTEKCRCESWQKWSRPEMNWPTTRVKSDGVRCRSRWRREVGSVMVGVLPDHRPDLVPDSIAPYSRVSDSAILDLLGDIHKFLTWVFQPTRSASPARRRGDG
jgi:hypothetical protein